MPAQTEIAGDVPDASIGLDDILFAVSRESHRLAEQCLSIQWSISTILEIVDHPDLGAEIHMLQDIDRIQQTLADVSALLAVTKDHANGASILKEEIGSAVRLESLRQRLGICEDIPDEASAPRTSDVTWL